MYYDPMISKLITYAETRDLAIEGMTQAIDDYIIRGVGHNTPFVADVCRHESFKKGDTPTSFIETHYPDGFQGVQLDVHEQHCLAASIACVASVRRSMLDSPPLAMAERIDIDDDYYASQDEDDEYGEITLPSEVSGKKTYLRAPPRRRFFVVSKTNRLADLRRRSWRLPR